MLHTNQRHTEEQCCEQVLMLVFSVHLQLQSCILFFYFKLSPQTETNPAQVQTSKLKYKVKLKKKKSSVFGASDIEIQTSMFAPQGRGSDCLPAAVYEVRQCWSVSISADCTHLKHFLIPFPTLLSNIYLSTSDMAMVGMISFSSLTSFWSPTKVQVLILRHFVASQPLNSVGN